MMTSKFLFQQKIDHIIKIKIKIKKSSLFFSFFFKNHLFQFSKIKNRFKIDHNSKKTSKYINKSKSGFNIFINLIFISKYN